MDNIKVLEEIGLKRVCEETHIEQKYLKYMVDCDFDKLDHINTQGFIKILSREYKLDLSEWTEEFEEYWIENRQDKEDDGLFIVVDDKKSSKKFLFFLLSVILIATASVLFSIFQNKIDISNYVSSDEVVYEQTTLVKEAQQSLDEANNSLEEKIITSEVTYEEENATTEEIVIVDENISQDIVVEKEETNDTLEEEKPELEQLKEPIENVSLRFDQEAIIIPNSQLWIGVIYLDDKKRRSYLGEGNFSIDISREQIITTGHGSFKLDINGEKREFNKQAPIRFFVKDLNVTEINWSKFKELNEGKTW